MPRAVLDLALNSLPITGTAATWLLAALCLGAPALSAAQDTAPVPAPLAALPVLHTLDWDRPGVWAGYTLNGHRIEAAFVSDPLTEPGRAGFGELVALDVVGPSRRWAVRCAFGYGGLAEFTMACDFVPDDGGTPATLVLDTSTRGYLLGDAPLDVTANFFNLQGLELQFSSPEGAPVAQWAWRGLQFGYPQVLSTTAPSVPAHEVATLAVLASLLRGSAPTEPNVVAPSTGNRLDSYPVVARGPRAVPAQRAALATLEARGATHEADLLRRFLDETRGIDRQGGAFLERNPSTPRVVLGLQGGVHFAPDPEGAPGGLSGGSVEVVGGARLDRLVLTVAMGLHIGAVDAPRFANASGVPDLASVNFSLGFQTRYALPLVGGLEGVVGLVVAGRLRLVSVTGWAEADGARQLGFAVGPIVGLQYPLWALNDLGSRLVFAVEGIPEWSFWGTPKLTSPEGTEAQADRLKQGLSGGDLGVRAQVGFRLEL